ncbi:MAG: hypothetical protein RLZZ210_104 [Pseudomonadota bacterium]|jgi:ABC-type transporter Mla MlaB component
MNNDNNAKIETLELNKFSIQDLTHDNAQIILKQSEESLLKNKNLHIDFNSLQQFDSSVFAVILGLKRVVNKNNLMLNITLSPQLETLAGVYGITHLIS